MPDERTILFQRAKVRLGELNVCEKAKILVFLLGKVSLAVGCEAIISAVFIVPLLRITE
jgi:hypothetical protein